MPKVLRIVLGVLAALLLIFAVGPFLVPVAPLPGTLPADQLADPDSLFVDVQGLKVHYKQAGQGEPTLVLLHGFAASTFSWHRVMQPLAEIGTVVAFDRPSSGLTDRPMPGEWEGDSPYSREAQADLTVGLMDALGIDRAVLVGNSAGGTIGALVAIRHPQRVEALILVDAAIYQEGGAPSWSAPLLRTPQLQHLGPLIARTIQSRGDQLLRLAWHDPSSISSETLEGYSKALQAENWDVGLWQLTLASRPSDLPERLDELALPALVITGDDDRIVPTELSVRLAGELPNAELVVIPQCGHVPQEECPEDFLQAVSTFLARLP
jgi:pimeloyl-ACP methyl ester carboxylesterase